MYGAPMHNYNYGSPLHFFRYSPKNGYNIRPKPNINRKSLNDLRPKNKYAECDILAIFGAENETETEIRSVSISKERFESKMIPRFLADSTGVIDELSGSVRFEV